MLLRYSLTVSLRLIIPGHSARIVSLNEVTRAFTQHSISCEDTQNIQTAVRMRYKLTDTFNKTPEIQFKLKPTQEVTLKERPDEGKHTREGSTQPTDDWEKVQWWADDLRLFPHDFTGEVVVTTTCYFHRWSRRCTRYNKFFYLAVRSFELK